MKVLKFGGTSVGSENGLLNIKAIVERQEKPVIVVVSALGGVTDLLLRTASVASQGNDEYRSLFHTIVERHHDIINKVITDRPAELIRQADVLLDELASIYQGVYLIRDLSPKTQATIVSYGERLSSLIVARLMPASKLHDSRCFIKTANLHHSPVLESELTRELVVKEFHHEPEPCIHVVPGFISSDVNTGEVTNLGRGGSDYTASIIAAALNASQLEIWTDVDGFMTADPRVIPTAYTISTLSYIEAMELCNFGAKVIYPPTIYPVCVKTYR